MANARKTRRTTKKTPDEPEPTEASESDVGLLGGWNLASQSGTLEPARTVQEVVGRFELFTFGQLMISNPKERDRVAIGETIVQTCAQAIASGDDALIARAFRASMLLISGSPFLIDNGTLPPGGDPNRDDWEGKYDFMQDCRSTCKRRHRRGLKRNLCYFECFLKAVACVKEED
jgi:hypothetical protein